MKTIILGIFISVVVDFNCNCQVTFLSNKDSMNTSNVLHIFADVLNNLVKDDSSEYGRYKVIGEESYGFFVFDILDTTNFSFNGDIYIKNEHIYVFSSLNYRYLFINICFINDEKIVVFRALNCNNKGDDFVILNEFIKANFTLSQQCEILNRLNNYEKYATYFRRDNYSSIKCELSK